MRKKSAKIFPKSFFQILPLLIFAKLTKCQQSVEGGNRVKIMAECANEQLTLHVKFNEDTLPNGRFTDWIIVGLTNRPECRLKGNGELRYIVQIAVLKDPCATKLMAPGVFQNTLRIASFPGLILSDDLNFEFKCAHGTPEIWELRLPQGKRTESENNEQQLIVPIRPPFPSPTTSSSSGLVSPSPSLLLTGGGLGHNLLVPSSSKTQQTHKNKFMVNTQGMNSAGNAWTEQKVGNKMETEGETEEEKEEEAEKQRTRSGGAIGTEDKQKQRQQQQERKDAELVVTDNDNFDVSNRWEERRGNAFPSNLLVVLCGFLALFLIGCVFMAIFQTVKQFRAARRAAPFAQLDSRTSPESDGSREKVGIEWRAQMTNCDSTTARRTNETRDQLQLGTIEGSYHTEELNLEPPSVPIPTIPLHSTKRIYGGEMRRPNLMKAFGSENDGQLAKMAKRDEGERDNEQIPRGEFNAAACRSITEIYRTAEIKLKSMMKEAEEDGTEATAGDYSTLKKLGPQKEREHLLISCVNKIRGYGSRKLTEQEILRWRQLIRNDANFQNYVFNSVSEEEMIRICELPQYRVLFTRAKWAQIVGCIAQEILDNAPNGEENGRDNGTDGGARQRNGSTDTVRRMKPLPPLPPGPTKFSSIALSQHQHKTMNHPNGSLNIFVGNGANSGETAERKNEFGRIFSD